MSRAARHLSLLVIAVSVAGCAASPATSANGGTTQSRSASAKPSGGKAAASADAAQAGPLGVLALPKGATPWTENRDTPMSLATFIGTFFDAADKTREEGLYTRRGFKSGTVQGWINSDGTQQSIAIARFSHASGATSAFDGIAANLRDKPAPDKAVKDPACAGVGTADPKLDSMGNAFVDIVAHVGDYLVDVHEFSAAAPDPVAASALLSRQCKALKSKA